jgi:hypothetical protein
VASKGKNHEHFNGKNGFSGQKYYGAYSSRDNDRVVKGFN